MKHLDILKQAFAFTWRYRALWLFGFFLALCGGGGGGVNFNFPSGGENLADMEKLDVPSIDPTLLIALIVGFICLVFGLIILGMVVQYVTRTALIGMVSQAHQTQAVTIRDGWRWGWARGAWRLFLINLLVGIPLFIISLILILMAFSPLLLLLADDRSLMIIGIILTVVAFIFILLLLMAISVVIAPILELAWRQAVLDQRGVIDSLRGAFQLFKTRFKDVAVLWLLLVGVGIGWGLATLVVVLPLSLLAAAIIGGIPALLVYLIAGSGVGAAIAGIPLGLIAFMLVMTTATGYYLIFQSAIWTLAYLELTRGPAQSDEGPTLAMEAVTPLS